jgi:2-oxoglutarate dehydrogenase E2 component (dihydrolipoamide succinyltransferase)
VGKRKRTTRGGKPAGAKAGGTTGKPARQTKASATPRRATGKAARKPASKPTTGAARGGRPKARRKSRRARGAGKADATSAPTGAGGSTALAAASKAKATATATSKATVAGAGNGSGRVPVAAVERVERLSPLRRRIGERLVAAQSQAALLTTFNEVDLSQVQELRRENQELFRSRYGVKLGLMSFFVRATVRALRQVPELNAELRGDQLVYRDRHDIGVAVGGGEGLVVPVLRDAGVLGFAEIEHLLADYADRARSGGLTLEELTGGTFTISSGGVYGSLLSTPIVNPPQSGILGLHVIQDRPVVREGAIVVRPMMYVALTYDHRVVDGRQAVGFLRHVKEAVEDPMLHLM